MVRWAIPGRLLGAGVLRDRLGTFGHGVLRQLAGQQQSDGSLDFPTADCRSLVVVRQTRRLGGNALEDVVDERVHDAHGLAGDSSVRVDLLEHLIDVNAETFLSPCAPLLRLVGRRGLFHSFLVALACSHGWLLDE